ncbi:hypothetical protein [Yinghuangia soli]|uniref:S1 motif domain-containing protein n=1 Tax=Yinghuangia soli TaxID=2908204 RepID=A0AA41Q3B2_9ACTN|nr:hypothetical protein [Yinghuangia soli]MCF2530764.1 hypothetical protein [Yinghuangia soli]
MAPFVYRISLAAPDPGTTVAALGSQASATPAAAADRPVPARRRLADACVAAVAGFAFDAGAAQLVVDNPMLDGFFSFAMPSPRRPAPGLEGLFPPDGSGFHDGARLPLSIGLELVRAMVLQEGVWCRLHGGDSRDGGFFVHVGYEDDIYVGGDRPFTEAAARARVLGLQVARVAESPFAPDADEVAGPGEEPAADDAFWTAVAELAAERGSVLLEEQYVGNAYRRHWISAAGATPAMRTVEEVRGVLGPRARLAVWPDAGDDEAEAEAKTGAKTESETVRAAVRRQDCLQLLVRYCPDGRFHPEMIAEPHVARADVPDPTGCPARGHRSALVPLLRTDRRPLLAAVVPDADGVVRARWRTDATPADRRRAYLAGLRVGDVVSGVVSPAWTEVGVYVELDVPWEVSAWGTVMGVVRFPHLSWTRVDSVGDVAPPGAAVRARVQDIDWAREHVYLSVRALQPDPWRQYADTVEDGEIVRGVVDSVRAVAGARVDTPADTTADMREGTGIDANTGTNTGTVVIRLADAVEAVVSGDDFAGHGAEAVPGDEVFVRITHVDRDQRRIAVSLAAAIAWFGDDLDDEDGGSFHPGHYGMNIDYDKNGDYVYPVGFDVDAEEWLPGFDDERRTWEQRYLAAEARFEAHKAYVLRTRERATAARGVAGAAPLPGPSGT